jgi:hypothetical protein
MPSAIDSPRPTGADQAEIARGRPEAPGAASTLVLVPRLTSTESADLGAIKYPLISFLAEPWTLTAPGRHLTRATQTQGADYADWLNGVEADRLRTIEAVLSQAGAPTAGLSDSPECLADLGSWVQQWFGVLCQPLVQQRFFHDLPQYRLGQASASWAPHLRSYSRHCDVLLNSLAHDLAFIVTSHARTIRPELRWQLAFDDQRQPFYVTPGPDSPGFDLIDEVRNFLVQSLARPRGGRGAELRRWYSGTLLRGYQRAATGIAAPTVEMAFPDADSIRTDPRYRLSRPGPSDPAGPGELVDAVAAFRQAGWFETTRLSSSDLARAARAAWLAYEHEDIPLTAAEPCWRLLVLDGGRTWSEDVNADVRPGDAIHIETMFALEGIGAPGFGAFADPEEDWASRPGDVLLTFRWRRRPCELLIPSPGQHLSAALITGLNGILMAQPQPQRQRLWFLDRGPPLAIVTRATAEERDALELCTGIQLSLDPPAWWTVLAPLPDRRESGPC